MQKVLKVNLGCGPVGKDGWINVDWGILAFLHRIPYIEKLLLNFNLFPRGYNVRWPKNLRLLNCRKRLPFNEGSVDYIYASHFLEHFKKFEAEKIISDCCRILKKGGVIRIAVPDLEILSRKYIDKDAGFFKKIYSLMNFHQEYKDKDKFLLADIFIDNFYPNFYKVKPSGINKLLNRFVRPHFWMYDYDSLSSLLENAGFKNIQRTTFQNGKTPDLVDLDVFPEMSLYLEAEK